MIVKEEWMYFRYTGLNIKEQYFFTVHTYYNYIIEEGQLQLQKWA